MRIQACCLHCVTFACNVYSVITGVYCNNTDHAVNPWPWYVCPPPPSATVYSLLTNVNIWEEYNTRFPHHACKFIVMNTCIWMHSTPPVRSEGGEMFWKICSLLHYCGGAFKFHTIQIIQPTRRNSFKSSLLDVYVWIKMFRASPRPSSGACNCTRSLWFNCWGAAAGASLVVVWQTRRSSRFLPTVNTRGS